MKFGSGRETGFPSRTRIARLMGTLRRIPSDVAREREPAMELVVIECGGCGAAIRVRHPEKPGRRICPRCRTVLVMPEVGEPGLPVESREPAAKERSETEDGLSRRHRRSVPSLVMNTTVMATLAVWVGWDGLDDAARMPSNRTIQAQTIGFMTAHSPELPAGEALPRKKRVDD